MTKITTLTADQTARMAEYRDKWIRIGLSTEPANRPHAESAVRKMYEIAGLPEPKIVWCGSPLAMGLTRAILQKVGDSVRASVWDSVWASVWDSVGNSVGNSVRASVWDSVGNSVGNSVRASVWDSVRASVWDSVRASVWDSVRASVWDSVGNSVWDSVWDSVRDSVGNSVRASVWDSVRASVWDSVGNSVRASVWDSVRASVWDSVRDSVYGSHDANWLAFYDYFRDVCGLTDQTDRLASLWELANSAGWALPHKGICWISERHCVVKQDEQKRIHCDDGPAIAYPDGFRVYAIHGVRVPAGVIEAPVTLDVIDGEQNQEVRRIMIDRYRRGEEIAGAAAYLRDSDAEVIDQDECWGILRRKKRPDDSDLLMIEVINNTPERDGSFKHYWLRVHPELRPIRAMPDGTMSIGEPQKLTAHNAVASTWGKRGEEFHVSAFRT